MRTRKTVKIDFWRITYGKSRNQYEIPKENIIKRRFELGHDIFDDNKRAANIITSEHPKGNTELESGEKACTEKFWLRVWKKDD